ncbi:NAD-dependent succinate-semialdehyde dehydrogenase [Mycolicibacterium sp. 050158]|uniref:NAD-dependent succinate-semialdehyde dehydrogenase n=1 Tax=Mycobacteriaceae TaxID=1762 RepID=UPI00299DC806|nr:NAD-dependent succinate-semialdehyde dehydrogenase [Mycolicibacterium sp. 050158]MDX1888027.1 NAD-dependent succinate-semialdehyde dehydrogenase [Mycolicibacterium sp. 050158]
MSSYTVIDPRSGEQLTSYPVDTDAEIDAKLDAAHGAYKTWARQTIEERVALLQRLAQLHEERQDALAEIIQKEMGKSREDALGEIGVCISIYRYYAENAAAFLADETIDVTSGPGTAVVQRRPVGVLLGIMPWNFPYYQVARFAGPNLALGNTILLKPAPQCPESGLALQGLFDDAGFPAGTYNNVFATNEQVERIIGDPRVQGVSVTGSERAGAAVAEIAGRNLKKVVLELGGSDPFIVLGVSDMDEAVDAAFEARMENTGQSCNAGKRVIVLDELYDDFVARYTAKMLARPASPVSSLVAAERLSDQVGRAVASGATLQTSGERDGAWFPPGVLTGVQPGGDVFYEEFFGPVAMVFRVQDEDEAIRIANDTPFGLGSYLFTTDAEQAHRVAEQLEAGMVYINGFGGEGAELPFGGIKRSGFGRELGRHGIDEFANKKLIRTLRQP